MKQFLLLTRKAFFVTAFVNVFFVASAQCPSGMVSLVGNVVTNGDFTAGNTGFSSGYAYCSSFNCLQPEGRYAVGATGITYHTAFRGFDHTTGSGNFMIVNGAATPNTSVWCQTIPVTPNTLYLFETWVSTMYPGSPARLQFSINDTLAGPVFTAPDNNNNTWLPFNATWNSGSATSASICIVNQNTAGGGNDFGLDDITFKPCTCNFKLPALADTTICSGNSLQLSLQPGAASYRWSPSADISCDTCRSVTVTPAIGTATYQATASLNTCTDSVSVLVTVQPSVTATWIAPPPVCAGQIVDLNTLLTGSTGGAWSGQGVAQGNFNSTGLSGAIPVTYAVGTGLCAKQESHDIQVAPSSNIRYSASICSGASFELPWGEGATSAGSYTHAYNSVSGCDSVVTYDITVNPSPAVTLTADKEIICPNDSALVCAPGGYMLYEWNVRGTTECVVAKQPGNYSVTVTSANECTAGSDALTINMYPVTSVGIIVQGSNMESFGYTNYQWMYEGQPISGATSAQYKAQQNGIYSLHIVDENGCENNSTGIFVSTTGIDELGNGAAFGFYPNPANRQLTVVSSPELVGEDMQFYDVSGKLVLKYTIEREQTEVRLDAMATGVYILKIAGGVRRLIIQ